MSRRISTHKAYLAVTSVLILVYAPLLLLASMEVTAEPMRWAVDLLSWPLDGNVTWVALETRFLSGITAGVLVGWGVMVWCLRVWVFDDAPEGVRRTVVVSAVLWFVVDSGGSILAGVPLNTLANAIFLVVAIGPLWWPAEVAAAA
ncbi:MAG: hypothetical protein AAGI10_08780 [Pseudomonadota bacterium]